MDVRNVLFANKFAPTPELQITLLNSYSLPMLACRMWCACDPHHLNNYSLVFSILPETLTGTRESDLFSVAEMTILPARDSERRKTHVR